MNTDTWLFLAAIALIAVLAALLTIYRYIFSSPKTSPVLAFQAPAPDDEDGERLRKKRLKDLTPEEIRAVAWRYGFKVTGRAGNTGGRILFFTLCALLAFVIISLPTSLLLFFAPVWVRFFFTFGVWMAVFGGYITWRYFIIMVPQLTGVKALNPIGGKTHTYMPGLNFKYPQEIVTKNDWLSLRSDVISEKSEFTSQDGIKVHYDKPSLRWRVFPPLLMLNVSHSSATINLGATEIFKTTLSNLIIHSDIKEIRTATFQEDAQQELTKALEGRTLQHLDAHGSTFEEQYGVTAEIPALGPPALSQEYAAALEGKASMSIYEDSAHDLVLRSRSEGSKEPMEFGDALNAVMITAGQKVNKNIIELKTDANTREGLSGFGKGAGPLIAGAAAVANKLSGNQGGGT